MAASVARAALEALGVRVELGASIAQEAWAVLAGWVASADQADRVASAALAAQGVATHLATFNPVGRPIGRPRVDERARVADRLSPREAVSGGAASEAEGCAPEGSVDAASVAADSVAAASAVEGEDLAADAAVDSGVAGAVVGAGPT